MDLWSALHYVKGRFLMDSAVSATNGRAGYTPRIVIYSTHLTDPQGKIKALFLSILRGFTSGSPILVSEHADVFNLKFNHITRLNPAVEFPSTSFSDGAGA